MPEVIIPHNAQAEEALLNAIMIKNAIMEDVRVEMKPEYFYRETYRVVYNAMLALYAQGNTSRKDTIDVVTLTEYLAHHYSDDNTKQNDLERVGGLPALTKIANSVPTAANWHFYVEIIRKKWLYRSILNACELVAAKARSEADAPEALQDAAVGSLASIDMPQDLPRISDAAEQVVSGMTAKDTWVQTGISDLDKLIDGFLPGDLVLVVASPGTGKSATLTQMFINASLAGKHALYVSLEMDQAQVVARIMGNVGHVNTRAFRARGRNVDDPMVSQAVDILESRQMDTIHRMSAIVDDKHASITDIARYIRGYRKLFGAVDVVYIDQLSWLPEYSAASARKDLVNGIGRITKRLLGLGKREGVPIVMAHQLNRDSKTRADKRPALTDLKDSGWLEADATMVLGLYNDDNDPNRRGLLDIDILKNRYGTTGRVTVRYVKEYSQLLPLATTQADAVKKYTETITRASTRQQEKGKNLFGPDRSRPMAESLGYAAQLATAHTADDETPPPMDDDAPPDDEQD